MKYLTLFSIGPVQSFIAKARKLQDLYAGSFLLSYLTKQTILEAQKRGGTVLFPDPELFTSSKQESAPNRFLMTVETEGHDGLHKICDGLENYVRQEWIGLARKVFDKTRLEYSPAVSAQIDSLIQVYYASEKYRDGKGFGESYIKVIKRLGAAKTLRGFKQLDEPYGRKCSLNHEHNALFYREKRGYLTADAQKVTESNIHNLDKYIKPHETLGAVAFVKRCLNYALPEFDDKFPSVANIFKMRDGDLDENDDDNQGYYAVVMFDGDNMGTWYSKPEEKGVRREKTETFQRFLSRQISQFASEYSRKTVDWKMEGEKKNGVVVYAGGEDFLGALNINSVFPALNELRKTFGKIDLSEYTEAKLSFSAGVVIAHVKAPLSAVLDMARDAEHKAKKSRKDKDAFCLTIAKHSGETTEFVMPFYHDEKNETSNLETLEELIKIIVVEKLSVKFIYQLSMELERIAETEDKKAAADNRDIFLAEAERLLKHSEFEDADKRNSIVSRVVGILAELAEDSEFDLKKGFDLKNMLMYLRAVAFLARERGAV